MKVNRRKTAFMCVNERQDTGSGTVKMLGEEVAKVDDFKYLGSTVQRNGECGREVKKRVQAGWNGWRRMSGVICDRRVPARVKGKVYKVAARPAMLYGLETVALTKRHEAEMEVAELNMLRFSLGVTRMNKIRNEYIRGTTQVGKLTHAAFTMLFTSVSESPSAANILPKYLNTFTVCIGPSLNCMLSSWCRVDIILF